MKLTNMLKPMKLYFSIVLFLFILVNANAEDGHQLWLRNNYSNQVNVDVKGKSESLEIAIQELKNKYE